MNIDYKNEVPVINDEQFTSNQCLSILIFTALLITYDSTVIKQIIPSLYFSFRIGVNLSAEQTTPLLKTSSGWVLVVYPC